MASPVKDSIAQAVKDAMRARDKQRLGVLRMLMSEFKRVEVDERIELDDVRVLAILDKAAKQRRDAAQQYRDAERSDLAETEEFEISVIQDYLPKQLSSDELGALVDQAIASTAAASMADMGKLMAVLKPQVHGRADMGEVSKLVKQKLN
ncbi:GatB/YqeY domain-containing protein [Agaribacterium haliotis]|uniref:GatB/YqeY domain-containing protein n=1 Tax=Agaribacterium haliotis TaxID=2013869 RepID=UPI000BB584E9|nr:GatB/YqeY domain-containing protein [Agaribacterium haliotis]